MGRDNQYNPPQKAKMAITSLSIKQFSQILSENYLISIIGEPHFSQAAIDMQRDIFEMSKSKMLFLEQPSTDQTALEKRLLDTKGNWNTNDSTLQSAYDRKIPTKAVDLAHYELPESTRLMTVTVQYNKGFIEGCSKSFELAVDYLLAHGVKEDEVEQSIKEIESVSDPDKMLERFFDKFGDRLPKFHKDNIRESVEDVRRYYQDGICAKISTFIDRKLDIMQARTDARERIRQSDPIFVENMDNAIKELAKEGDLKNFHGTLKVGAGHSAGIEKGLEQRGYNTANIIIILTDKLELDGKVCQNQRPKKGEAEWAVLVYDPDSIKMDKYGRNYEIVAPSRPVDPKSMPHSPEVKLGR
jgi:hypothetical protein